MKNAKPAIILLFTILFFKTTFSQEKSPLIKGTINISIKNGTIACDFIMSDMPDIPYYVIRLNSGMNVHYFKDVKRSPEPLYYDMDKRDTLLADETAAYLMHENTGNPARYLPEQLEVKYLGMLPVVADSASGYMGQDWRGNIAFNGYSIRADGMQGAWYPILYDMKKQHAYYEVRYDINVSCNDCSVLFVNGSAPVKAKTAHFVSDVPRDMAIYCGNFETTEVNNTWILNPDMPKNQQKELLDVANSYKLWYQKALNIPFKGNLTFIQTAPTADPTKWAFSFQASPTTFTVSGSNKWGLGAMFNNDAGARPKQTMAHELAHYYFGDYLHTNTAFGAIINEGFAEFLSFKLTKNLVGDAAYNELLTNKLNSLKYFKGKPLSVIKNTDDYGNREYYLYYYSVVVLTAIEKEIGEQAMWHWIITMLNTKTDFTDYNFFIKTFDVAITDKALNQRIKDKYFTSDKALDNAREELGVK
ncbi:MAG: M1 family aminopeptidase [Mucilaginibacter sp.]